jgi:hypothetical protein
MKTTSGLVRVILAALRKGPFDRTVIEPEFFASHAGSDRYSRARESSMRRVRTRIDACSCVRVMRIETCAEIASAEWSRSL